MCVWYRNTDANIADRSQKITPPVINYVKWQRWKLWKCRAAAFYRGGQKSQPRSVSPGVPLWRWQQRSRQPRAECRSVSPGVPLWRWQAKMPSPCEVPLRGSVIGERRSHGAVARIGLHLCPPPLEYRRKSCGQSYGAAGMDGARNGAGLHRGRVAGSKDAPGLLRV